MKIAIDAYWATYKRGIGNYISNLLEQFYSQDLENEYLIYCRSGLQLNHAPKNFKFITFNTYIYPVWEQLIIPSRLAIDKPDIFHAPANTGPLFLPRNIRLILTLHDTIFLLSNLKGAPFVYQKVGRWYRQFVTPKVAHRADAIITVSEASRLDILNCMKVKEEKVWVIYESASKKFATNRTDQIKSKIKNKINITTPYIFHLGGIDLRKNTFTVLKCFSIFKRKVDTKCTLVISGLPAYMIKAYAAFSEKLNLKKDLDVVFTNFISEEDLIGLYSSAVFFLYPSRYEGFGIPLLEAMACGTPVITSKISSMPEIAGEAAIFIDPDDEESILQAMLHLWNDKGARETLIKQGVERSKIFSWEKAAKGTLEVYGRLGAERGKID